MSSTAFPRVAFSSPPRVSPNRRAASSVAKPSRPAVQHDQLLSSHNPASHTERNDGDEGGDENRGIRDRPNASRMFGEVKRPAYSHQRSCSRGQE
jgi:hypothetical protein